MKVDVRDRRSHGWFAVYREDLERLAAACEPRQRASVRSVYLALLDAANEGRSEACALSRRELAARAGVGPKGLTSAVEALERAGLLEVESGQNNGSTNVWTLLSPEEGGGSAKTQGVGQQRPRGWVRNDPPHGN